jgi:predicted nucleic acid-binding protein
VIHSWHLPKPVFSAKLSLHRAFHESSLSGDMTDIEIAPSRTRARRRSPTTDPPPAWARHPPDRHPTVLRELLTPLGAAGNLTTDAHLAALAIEHGAALCSCDSDFSRFPGLRWIDPLQAG